MKNVQLRAYAVVGEADKGSPHVAFVNDFEEIKVKYTEYDDTGSDKGNVEYEDKVGQ
jgi:hypothetical protein